MKRGGTRRAALLLHYSSTTTTLLPLNYNYEGVSHVGQHAAVRGERRLDPEAVELKGAGGGAWEAADVKALERVAMSERLARRGADCMCAHHPTE